MTTPTPLQPSQEALAAALEHYPADLWIQAARDDLAQAFASFEASVRADQRERDAQVADDRAKELRSIDGATSGVYARIAELEACSAAIRKEAP